MDATDFDSDSNPIGYLENVFIRIHKMGGGTSSTYILSVYYYCGSIYLMNGGFYL